MKYRIPVVNEIIDIPDSVVKTPRERNVLLYDIRAFEDDQHEIPHFEYVAQLMSEELDSYETASSVRSVKDRVTRRVNKQQLVHAANENLLYDTIQPERSEMVDDLRERLAKEWWGTSYTSSFVPVKTSKKRRVCVVSDYHGAVHPFIARSLLNADFDLYIHAGDILDQWGMHSARIEGKSLTQQEKVNYLSDEMDIMRAWFTMLDEQGKKHIVIAGNHDVRVEAAFVRLLDPVIRNESLLVRMFRTPLELLVEGLTNVELGTFSNIWKYPDGSEEWAAESKFFYLLGDAVISHKNFTGKQPGTAVGKLWEWIQSYRHVLSLSDVRLCLQAHTHSLMLDKNCQGGHVNLVETGCALKATALGYGLTYNGNWTPSAVGYVTFEQFDDDGNWKTDLASVQLHGVS